MSFGKYNFGDSVGTKRCVFLREVVEDTRIPASNMLKCAHDYFRPRMMLWTKFWGAKIWRTGLNSPNLPNLCPSNFTRYTVAHNICDYMCRGNWITKLVKTTKELALYLESSGGNETQCNQTYTTTQTNTILAVAGCIEVVSFCTCVVAVFLVF